MGDGDFSIRIPCDPNTLLVGVCRRVGNVSNVGSSPLFVLSLLVCVSMCVIRFTSTHQTSFLCARIHTSTVPIVRNGPTRLFPSSTDPLPPPCPSRKIVSLVVYGSGIPSSLVPHEVLDSLEDVDSHPTSPVRRPFLHRLFVEVWTSYRSTDKGGDV